MFKLDTFKYKFGKETITIKNSLYTILLFIFWTVVISVAEVYTFIKFLNRGENKIILIISSIIFLIISLIFCGIVIGRILFKLSFSKNGIEICSWKGKMAINFNDLKQWGVIKNCGGFMLWERDVGHYREDSVYFSKIEIESKTLRDRLYFKLKYFEGIKKDRYFYVCTSPEETQEFLEICNQAIKLYRPGAISMKTE